MPRRILDDAPANEQEAVADLFQWLLFLDDIIQYTGQPVNARYLAAGLRDLATAGFAQPGNANEVRLAWQQLLDVMGSKLLGMFIMSKAWEGFAPKVSKRHDTDSLATLWVGDGKKVVARVTFRQEVPTDIRIDVQ
jgi:hypothetical protein